MASPLFYHHALPVRLAQCGFDGGDTPPWGRRLSIIALIVKVDPPDPSIDEFSTNWVHAKVKL